MTPTRLAPLLLACVLACDRSPTTPTADPVDPSLPGEVAGETLEVREVGGAQLVANDPAWAALLDQLGATAADVSLAVAAPPHGSSLDVRIASLRIAGVAQAPRLATFITNVQSASGGSISFAQVRRAGRDVQRGTQSGGDIPPAYYYAVGDVVFVVQSASESVVDEVLATLPASSTAASPPAGMSAASAPLPASTSAAAADRATSGVLMVTVLRFPALAVCIGFIDPPAFIEVGVFLDGMPLAFANAQPVPSAGSTMPSSSYGMHHLFLYNAERWLFGTGETGTVFVQAAGQSAEVGLNPYVQVRHCMNGLWQDGPRLLRVDQVVNSISAQIEEGTLVCDVAGQAFTGTMGPADPVVGFAGADLKVCNPQPCYEAGLMDREAFAPYTAQIADDSRSVGFVWERRLVDIEYDENGDVTACTFTGTEDRTFSIGRLTFGPGVPF